MNVSRIIDLERLAFDVADEGIAGHDAQLGAVASAARRRGEHTLADIVDSTDAPAAARARALGRIAAVLANAPGEPASAAVDAA